MTKLFLSQTLDDALTCLGEIVEQNENNREKTLVFCEDKLTLLAEQAILKRIGGTFLTEVTTFSRYLQNRSVLTKQGSVMIVFSLIEALKDRLYCFREGSARAVYETIAQFLASRVDENTLGPQIERCDGALKKKLSDLSLLLSAYSKMLEEQNLFDENKYLSLLPEEIKSKENGERNVVFFGFPSFTKQAQEGVKEALLRFKSASAIFLAGREGLYTNEAAKKFYALSNAYFQKVPSSLSGDALYLHENLFRYERKLPKKSAKSIITFVSRDEEEELKTVAALIKREVYFGKRYRDLAVLVPDKESLPVLEKVFSAYKIPFFADEKRPFSAHPFARLLFAAIPAVFDGVTFEEAEEISSSVYFGDRGEYRNYLSKFCPFRGGCKKPIKEEAENFGFSKEEIKASREKLLKIVSLFPAKGHAREFSEGIKALYEFLEGEKREKEIGEFLSFKEQSFLKIDPLFSLLSEMETLSKERVFSAREFALELRSGLDALEIGFVPKSQDAVFVGDATDSSFSRVKTLFVTGASLLPRAGQDSALISDFELERLKALEVEIEPAIKEVNLRNRESLGLNLCAFEEALYLSYSKTRFKNECAQGEIFREIDRIFSPLPLFSFFPFDCSELLPAELKLLSLREETRAGREDTAFSSLYSALEKIEGREKIEKLISSHEKPRVPLKASVSPTALEKYFECPYASFAESELRLVERGERAVGGKEFGSFLHAVLEECARAFNDIESESELCALARKKGEALLALPKYAALFDAPEGNYAAKRLLEECEEVALGCFRQLKGSAFLVDSTEKPIFIDELSLEGKSDRVDLSEEYVRVIDYKTGKIDSSASAYYTGRKLQLELYLKAASKGKIPAGAFYFPAQDRFVAEGEERFRMSGFYRGDEEVVRRMDKTLKEGEKSAFFEGRLDGKYTDKGMEEFDEFLDYAVLVSARAERERKEGFLSPSPYEGACDYCKFGGLCGFIGKPRKETGVSCAQIVQIVKREKGE